MTVPVMSIQCDWEDFIELPHKQIWISCKFRGENSAHAKLVGGTLACESDSFAATLGKNSLCVTYKPTGHLARFIPPCKVFNKVHTKGALSIDVADGGLGVSACGGNQLLVWDNTTGEVRRKLGGHLADVYKCKLFPSGIVVLSGGADMSLKIWSAETGQCPVTLTGHTGSITDFSIVDLGRNIISVSKDGTSKLWDCGRSNCLATILQSTNTLNCCSIGLIPDILETVPESNDREIGTRNKVLLVGSEEGTIFGLGVSSRSIIFTTNTDSAVNVILYFSQHYFVAGTQDGRIFVCNTADGLICKTIFESNSPVLSLAKFQDKGVFVGRYDGTLTFYSLVSETADRLQLTGSDLDPIYSIAISSDSVYAACRDSKIRVYKVSDIIAGGV